MAFIIFFSFCLKKFEKVWKSWKNWNYLHKIFGTMYSICYTRGQTQKGRHALEILNLLKPIPTLYRISYHWPQCCIFFGWLICDSKIGFVTMWNWTPSLVTYCYHLHDPREFVLVSLTKPTLKTPLKVQWNEGTKVG